MEIFLTFKGELGTAGGRSHLAENSLKLTCSGVKLFSKKFLVIILLHFLKI